MTTNFRDQMRLKQRAWRQRSLSHVQGQGSWQKKQYAHILPRGSREENLWPGIQRGGQFPLDAYLSSRGIQAHTGRDNLLSSWTLAANLYFPFGQSPEGRRLVAGFLAVHVDGSISSVQAVELEWEHPHTALQPPNLLGETDGSRGTNQTSPDVAFDVTLRGGGRGIVLTEVKFTEHNFYACSIRKQLDAARRAASCHTLPLLQANPPGLCGQHTEKGRRYWDHLQGVFDWKAPLRWCPAATAGYQMFRQQALAEALAVNSSLGLVVSALAYHEGNAGLIGSLRRTGRVAGRDALRDIRTDWAKLFNGRAKFKTFKPPVLGGVRPSIRQPGSMVQRLVGLRHRPLRPIALRRGRSRVRVGTFYSRRDGMLCRKRPDCQGRTNGQQPFPGYTSSSESSQSHPC